MLKTPHLHITINVIGWKIKHHTQKMQEDDPEAYSNSH